MEHATHGMQAIGYAAAFVAGIAGSVHCLAMCGGLSGALGMRARRQGISAERSVFHAGAGQLGRIGSYGVAGALCGAFGALFAELFDFASVTRALRIGAGLLLIAVACKVMFNLRLLQWLEQAGAHFWRRIAPLSAHLGGTSLPQSLLLGALWGWLPCGLVYSMLLFAAFTGDALQGAGIMLAFGAGTLPSMLGTSLFASQLTRLTLGRKVHFAAGVLLLAFGLWTALAPLQHVAHTS